MRETTLFLFLAAACSVSQSQDHRWVITLAGHTTIDSVTLSSVDRDSLRIEKVDTLRALPLADVVEIRRAHHVNLASYILIGAFAGIPIGFIARATDANARVRDVGPLLYFGEGALIGTTGGLLLAWLSGQDEVYTFAHESRFGKQYLVQNIIDDEGTKAAVERRDDSISTHEKLNPLRHWITADYGAGIFNYIGRGWQPQSSFRIGYGIGPSPNLTFCAHFDYCVNTLAKEDVMSSRLSPGSARRYEYSLYGGWVILKIVEVGGGVRFRTSRQVYNEYFGGAGPPVPWTASGTTDFRFFYVIGIGYQIGIAGGIMVPVGLYFENATYGDNGGPTLFRIGLGYRF